LWVRWLRTRSPVVNADMSESSAAITVAQTTRANVWALTPGWSALEPLTPSIWSVNTNDSVVVMSNMRTIQAIKVQWVTLSFAKLRICLLGPFYGAIAVPSVTRFRCRCCRRRGHRCAGGVRQYRYRHLVNGNVAARSSEWAQHFSNASCLHMWWYFLCLYFVMLRFVNLFITLNEYEWMQTEVWNFILLCVFLYFVVCFILSNCNM